MSDQPGIPALTVFPPFNPAAQRPAPAPAQPPAPPPAADAAPPVAESAEPAPTEAEAAPPAPSTPEAMPWDAEPAGLEASSEPVGEPADWFAAADDRGDEPAPWDAVADEPAAEAAPWDAVKEEPADQPAPWEPAAADAPKAEPWTSEPPAAELDYPGDPATWGTEADADVAEPMPWDYEAPELQTPEAAEAAAGDAGDDEDLPWLELPAAPRVHPVDEPSAETPIAGTPSMEAVAEADDWMSWAGAGEETAAPAEDRTEPEVVPIGDLEAAPAASAAEVPPTFAEPETTSIAHGGSWQPPAEEERSDAEVAAEWAHPESAAAPAAASPAPAPASATAGAFDDVAARLEAIARALRDDPQGFLSGAHGGDPLSLLVTGFAMGVNAARGAGNS